MSTQQQQQQQQKPIYLMGALKKRNAKAIKTAEPSELVEEINNLRSQLATAHNEINQIKTSNIATTQQVSEVKTKTDYLYEDKMSIRDAQKYVIKEYFKVKVRNNQKSKLDIGIFNESLYKFSKDMGIPIQPIEAQSLMSELNYPYSVCDELKMCYYPGIEIVE